MLRTILICCVLAGSVSGAEEKGFSHSLAEAEFKASGLDKLTVEERARLDELVAKAQAAQTTAVAASAAPAAEAKPVRKILHGKIAGALAGWSEGTVLVLEDGQRWKVISKGSYRAAPVRKSPKLELFPLSNGDYVMTIETVPMRAEVRRVAE